MRSPAKSGWRCSSSLVRRHHRRERGRFYLARYKGLDKIRSPLLLFAFDHRLEAYAAYTEGIVRLAGRGSGAEEAFRAAWVIFDRIGFHWRAARTALRLLEVTNKDRWRHLAEDKLEAFPNSWLARELRIGMQRRPRPSGCRRCKTKSSRCSVKR